MRKAKKPTPELIQLEDAPNQVGLPEDYRQLSPVIDQIFRKYRIVSRWREKRNGQEVSREGYTEINLRKSRSANGEPLGRGLLLSMQALNAFVNVDKTEDKRWLDWMLFQVGGGKEGQRRSEQAIESTRDRFIDERVRGFRDQSGTFHDPVSEVDAKARWERNRDRFVEVLTIGDQDMLEKLQVFGFHRNWPGPGGVYERAVNTVAKAQRMRRKFLAMNKFYQIEGKKDRLVGTVPEDFATVDLLEAAIKKVDKFFVTRLARKDNRVDFIMDNEDVTVLAPLTYAAAVRYGWDAWPWAVQNTFEDRLEEKGNDWNDPWLKVTKNEKQVIVYITFKCAMPSWITFENSKFSRSSFQNLALLMPTDSFRTMPIMEAKVHDEEGRSVLTLGEVRQQLGAEFARKGEEVPEEAEYPLRRGPCIFSDEAEFKRALKAFDDSVRSVERWRSKFKTGSIVIDYLGVAA